MDLQGFFNEHKELVGIVIGGLFAIVAALIKSKMKFSPPVLWFFASLICLAVGGALLFMESEKYHFDPEVGVSLDNKGSLFALGGCLLVATGAIWGIINFGRLFIGRPDSLPDAAPGKKKK
jgi:hypothetical protein